MVERKKPKRFEEVREVSGRGRGEGTCLAVVPISPAVLCSGVLHVSERSGERAPGLQSIHVASDQIFLGVPSSKLGS
jgi:hypothetical protein